MQPQATQPGRRAECAWGSGICCCPKEPPPNQTQGEKKKYRKVVQHDEATSSLGKLVVRLNIKPRISSVLAMIPLTY